MCGKFFSPSSWNQYIQKCIIWVLNLMTYFRLIYTSKCPKLLFIVLIYCVVMRNWNFYLSLGYLNRLCAANLQCVSNEVIPFFMFSQNISTLTNIWFSKYVIGRRSVYIPIGLRWNIISSLKDGTTSINADVQLCETPRIRFIAQFELIICLWKYSWEYKCAREWFILNSNLRSRRKTDVIQYKHRFIKGSFAHIPVSPG